MDDFDLHIMNTFGDYLDVLQSTKLFEGSFGRYGEAYDIGLAAVLTIIDYLEKRRTNK